MLISKFIFFFSIFMIFYIYFGYPLLVFLIGVIKNNRVNKDFYEPYVTILIAAYNEENSIEAIVKNKLEIIVVVSF